MIIFDISTDNSSIFFYNNTLITLIMNDISLPDRADIGVMLQVAIHKGGYFYRFRIHPGDIND